MPRRNPDQAQEQAPPEPPRPDRQLNDNGKDGPAEVGLGPAIRAVIRRIDGALDSRQPCSTSDHDGAMSRMISLLAACQALSFSSLYKRLDSHCKAFATPMSLTGAPANATLLRNPLFLHQ